MVNDFAAAGALLAGWASVADSASSSIMGAPIIGARDSLWTSGLSRGFLPPTTAVVGERFYGTIHFEHCNESYK